MATVVLSKEIEEELIALSTKVAVPIETLKNEFQEKIVFYKGNELTAMHGLRGGYLASLKSSAKAVKGIFIGVTQKQNANKWTLKKATELIDDYKKSYGEGWLIHALEHKVVDKDGSPVYTEENTKAKWLLGKPIPAEAWQRQAYGIFEIDGVAKAGTVFLKDPDGWFPKFGVEYQFKGSCGKLDGEHYSITSTKVFNPIPTGEKYDFDTLSKMIEQYYLPNCATFEQVYDLASENIGVIASVKPRAIISLAIMTSINQTDESFGVDYVTVTPLSSFGDVVSMRLDKKATVEIVDGASGILVYSPYYKKDSKIDGNIPTGEVLGFIPEDHFKPVKPEDPSETTVRSEYE